MSASPADQDAIHDRSSTQSGDAAPVRRVLAFYRFFSLPDPARLCEELLELGQALDLKGTILLATEGINGTVVGLPDALQQLCDRLMQCCGPVPFKWSELDPENPGFYRFKCRVKNEIVSFGVPGLDPRQTGEHVDADTWNALLADPDTVVIDTRNQYEIDIGTFPEAISPGTTNFREFPEWAEANLDPQDGRPIAMFCTGGIRCEKASAWLLQQGFNEVYQLDGGVLRYLETVDEAHNAWSGECFVFDQRVSVDRELRQGNYQQCFACRHPLSETELADARFIQGVSCPHCADDDDATRREGLLERQRQVALAEARGTRHIGQPQGGTDESDSRSD